MKNICGFMGTRAIPGTYFFPRRRVVDPYVYMQRLLLVVGFYLPILVKRFCPRCLHAAVVAGLWFLFTDSRKSVSSLRSPHTCFGFFLNISPLFCSVSPFPYPVGSLSTWYLMSHRPCLFLWVISATTCSAPVPVQIVREG